MTDTTGPEMRRALAMAEQHRHLTDPSDPYPAETLGQLARALLAANAEVERMRRCMECIEHDIAIVTQHRNARQSGGQHVGTGGPLGAANPSMLAYLERVVRDMRATQNATTIAAAGRGRESE